MLSKETFKLSQVFVPGGIPEHTYVPRTERRLEEQMIEARDNLCKIVSVTGMTKSGKTVLTNRIFPRSQCVWVDGGAVSTEDDFWNTILFRIGGYTESISTRGESKSLKVGVGVKGEGKLPLLASASGQVDASKTRSDEQVQQYGLAMSPRTAAISQLETSRTPLVIDDFHYLKREFQGSIVRALKPLILQGLPVILIAIPHRRYDSVKVEREMTGRLESVNVPAWTVEELLLIPNQGFQLLNVLVQESVIAELAKEAFGSPHLMQEFCRALARDEGILETAATPRRIDFVSDELFSSVAEGTGKVIFDKLARGPRQRKDRMQRELRDGRTADIYEATLLALAELEPGLDTVDYETLRAAFRSILAQNIPQAGEITRVLDQMSEIATSDESSTPVLDWERDERRLHITDPFFAFYLKWGLSKR